MVQAALINRLHLPYMTPYHNLSMQEYYKQIENVMQSVTKKQERIHAKLHFVYSVAPSTQIIPLVGFIYWFTTQISKIYYSFFQ